MSDTHADGPILVVDNYDSFAYNLVQYVGTALQELGHDPYERVVVRRNDAVTVADIEAMAPAAIVVSPGPGTPEDAGVSMPVFADLAVPTLGVCLGHQALCAANGAPVGHAPEVVHGKPSVVTHDGQGVFTDLPDRFEVGRYHSLAVKREDLPDSLVETARTEDVRVSGANAGSSGEPSESDGDAGVVMGVRHRERPHEGVQFHPESILTEVGLDMIRGFVRRALE